MTLNPGSIKLKTNTEGDWSPNLFINVNFYNIIYKLCWIREHYMNKKITKNDILSVPFQFLIGEMDIH